MTPDQLITKAIHCLNTGQPNLAKLYMKKGAATIREQRRRIATEKFELIYGAFLPRAMGGINLSAETPGTPSAIALAVDRVSLAARLGIIPAPLLVDAP
ncbi:hypothetical protein LJ753_11010 [Arthrobacter sp. zg-Y20]|uniref:hypothetical protein n=1 Tax=unclassified Arthrobacter TaxID=235627 RepID=UPI001D143849|nr:MULTISPECIES: hypothetical protein [unclassified Arthrobacter]MCC3276399.1 hypothetical protein [Arthrobacter sp. zg-Y20]MDK1316558.1 hypothetical protein [Arthrobacter sp. zg.Y20]WIB06598.1 hypothetical protein QNO06_02310 [Arthrobacter sp. zg-Y20]